MGLRDCEGPARKCFCSWVLWSQMEVSSCRLEHLALMSSIELWVKSVSLPMSWSLLRGLKTKAQFLMLHIKKVLWPCGLFPPFSCLFTQTYSDYTETQGFVFVKSRTAWQILRKLTWAPKCAGNKDIIASVQMGKEGGGDMRQRFPAAIKLGLLRLHDMCHCFTKSQLLRLNFLSNHLIKMNHLSMNVHHNRQVNMVSQLSWTKGQRTGLLLVRLQV